MLIPYEVKCSWMDRMASKYDSIRKIQEMIKERWLYTDDNAMSWWYVIRWSNQITRCTLRVCLLSCASPAKKLAGLSGSRSCANQVSSTFPTWWATVLSHLGWVGMSWRVSELWWVKSRQLCLDWLLTELRFNFGHFKSNSVESTRPKQVILPLIIMEFQVVGDVHTLKALYLWRHDRSSTAVP